MGWLNRFLAVPIRSWAGNLTWEPVLGSLCASLPLWAMASSPHDRSEVGKWAWGVGSCIPMGEFV